MPSRSDLAFSSRFVSALVLLAAATTSACREAPSAAATAPPPPTPVTVATVTPRQAPIDFEYVGSIAGSREVEVRARVTGILERRLYEEGTRVAAGQVLFRIDPAPFRARVAEVEAELAQAQARLRQAERDLARLAPLAATEAVSRRELDDAESAVDLARAAVQSATARLDNSKIELGYTDVRAPLAGVAGRALKVEGSLAVAGSDSLLTTLAQTDPVYVEFGVPEAEHLKTRREIAGGSLDLDPAGFVVHLAASDGTPLDRTGKLGFSDYKADLTTGSFAARATVDNPDGALSPGQFVRVTLRGATRRAAVVVAQRAVLDGPTGKFVYVVGQGPEGQPIAEARPVEVGPWVHLDGALANGWVIEKGLAAGDRVIVDGTARIFFPGMPIAPQEAPTGA